MNQNLGEYLRVPSSSFADFCSDTAPELLPRAAATKEQPQATTIVAAKYADGVLLAGDRRATVGHLIVARDIEKVFAADELSLIGVAGSAGISINLVRLFQTEIEHYEKLEQVRLSLDGKANRLSALVRQNLDMAMRGLAAVPLYAGWDPADQEARIYSYDAVGGCYPVADYTAVGSGSQFARSALKKLYRQTATADECAEMVLQALTDAADDDSATSGFDQPRGIYPVIWLADASGTHRLTEDEVRALAKKVAEQRSERPDGPIAGGQQS